MGEWYRLSKLQTALAVLIAAINLYGVWPVLSPVGVVVAVPSLLVAAYVVVLSLRIILRAFDRGVAAVGP